MVTLNVSVAESRVYAGLRSEAKAALQRLGGLLFDERTPVNVSVRLGRPPTEIIAEAEAERPELIVMSGPKPSRWRRWLGQGIVEAVVRGAPCPTLVLPRQWQLTPEQYRQAFRPAAAEMDRGARLWAS